MLPTWAWLLVTAAGLALLAAWPSLRRARARLLERVGLRGDFRRVYERASDACILFIGAAWAIGGLVGIIRG